MAQASEDFEPAGGMESAGANDFLALIDELEQFAAEATRVPLTGKALLDEDELYAILDHIRRLLPGEIRRALAIVTQEEQLLRDAHQQRDQLLQEAEIKRDRMIENAEARRDQILADGKREAESRVADARRQAQQLIAETEVLHEAQREAQATVLAARKAAKELQDGADQYAEAVLTRLEKTLAEMLSQARQGRQFLKQAQKGPALRPVAGDDNKAQPRKEG